MPHLTFPILAILYIGPDQLMPLASALAANGGALMIFWRQVVGVARRVAGLFKRQQ